MRKDMSRPYDGRGRLNRNWQPPREGRNRHQTEWLYVLWHVAIALAFTVVILIVAMSGCSVLGTYLRQHGY